eukprot:5320371-Prymnesium_polylepis.3
MVELMEDAATTTLFERLVTATGALRCTASSTSRLERVRRGVGSQLSPTCTCTMLYKVCTASARHRRATTVACAAMRICALARYESFGFLPQRFVPIAPTRDCPHGDERSNERQAHEKSSGVR